MKRSKYQKRKGVSIYQRESDKKWVAMITLDKDIITGKQARKALYGSTENEINEKVDNFLFELRAGLYEPDSKDTLIQFLKQYHNIYSGCDMWKENYSYPESAKWAITTAELYKMYIDVHFEPYFKNAKLSSIKPITLDGFYNYKMNNSHYYEKKGKEQIHKIEVKALSSNSIIKLNTFIKAAFNYAIKNDVVSANPAQKVSLAPKEKYNPVILRENKFLLLLDHVQGTDDEIPIILGGGCGLRRGEIFGLSWEDINFSKNTIIIRNTLVRFSKQIEKTPKNTSSERTIYVPGYVMDVLKEYEGKIAPNLRKDKIVTAWNPTSYSDRYKLLLKKFQLPACRLHDLRHYNAVIMCKYGVSDKVAADRLGHSQVSTLRNVYQHVLEEMDESAASILNNAMVSRRKEQ